LRGDRLKRGENAGQADVDRNVDRRAEAEGGQIDRRVAADHRSVDHAERDDRQLADQYRPRQSGDFSHIGEHGQSAGLW
jgi:hypothetical protein